VGNSENLKTRTKQFALRILRLYRALPAREEARILGRQILRSGTSVGANYRAACRARSKAEFVAKLGVVLEEADETVFWLELLLEGGIVKPEKLDSLLTEAQELTSIFVTSLCTAKASHRERPRERRLNFCTLTSPKGILTSSFLLLHSDFCILTF
jgi:four helix bundle protein